MRELLVIIVSAVAFLLFIAGLQFYGLISYQFFAPKYEAVRRTVWENTPSFYAGTRRDFDDLVLQYKQAKTDDERDAISSILRHRAAGAPTDLITPEVKQIIK